MQTVIAPVQQAFKTLRRSPRANRIIISAERIFIMPQTFEVALRQGWKIESERTTLEPTKRHRWGTVILAMKGQDQRLAVSYTATVRQGYRFGKPELI
jgi:hypothetical protein